MTYLICSKGGDLRTVMRVSTTSDERCQREMRFLCGVYGGGKFGISARGGGPSELSEVPKFRHGKGGRFLISAGVKGRS